MKIFMLYTPSFYLTTPTLVPITPTHNTTNCNNVSYAISLSFKRIHFRLKSIRKTSSTVVIQDGKMKIQDGKKIVPDGKTIIQFGKPKE